MNILPNILAWVDGISPLHLLAIGAGLGVVVCLLVLLLVLGRRRKMPRASHTRYMPRRNTTRVVGSKTQIYPKKNESARDNQDETNINSVTHPDFAKRETRLGEMIAEMRELVLHLTEIISKADSASGEATGRFEQAKVALNNLNLDDDNALSEVKVIILSEIDNVVKTNEVLKKQLVTAQTSMASQKKEIEVLKTTVRIDPLTQLPNRAAFDEYLSESLYRLQRKRELFSLLMIDVDYFKQINDTYGHVNGDHILKDIAAQIRDAVRQNDFASRYGGEEFAVILPDTPSEEALSVGDRMRDSIEKAHFKISNREIKVTISGGIAQCTYECEPEYLISVADKALYQSKVKGRNRITLGEDHIKEAWTTGERELRIIGTDDHENVAPERVQAPSPSSSSETTAGSTPPAAEQQEAPQPSPGQPTAPQASDQEQ